MSYHNTSSRTTSSTASSTIRSTTSAQGRVAPAGYHYMPDGTLMADADHVSPPSARRARQVVAAKKAITGIDIDFKDIRQAGETRRFAVTGNTGAVFSLEIKNEDSYYYNFQTNLFQAGATKLSNVTISGGVYNGIIKFPAVTDADQYDFYLFVETIYNTEHAKYKEVRFPDDTIDINSSNGSNSNLVQKVIYQTLDVDVTISGFSPNATVLGTSGSQVITTSRGKSNVIIPFSFTWTATSTRTLTVDKQPLSKDIMSFITATVGATPVDIPGEDIYPTVTDTDVVDGDFGAGSTHKIVMDNNVADKMAVGDRITTAVTTDTVDGAVENIGNGGKIVMDNNVATKMAVGDRVTITGGTTLRPTVEQFDGIIYTVTALNPDGDNAKEFSFETASEQIDTHEITDGTTLTFSSELNRKVITVSALNPDTDNAKEFSMQTLSPSGAAVASIGIRDNATLSFSSQRNHRWAISSTSVDVGKIKSGMRQTTASFFTTQPIVKEYLTQTTVFEGEIGEYKVDDVRIPAVETLGMKPVFTRNDTTKVKTSLTGTAANPINVTFSEQALLTFGGGANAKIFGYGTREVERLTGYDVEFSDLRARLTEISTTTTAVVSASTSVPITNRAGIMDGISTVSGVGIDPSVAAPSVSSGAGSVTGAGTIVLSAAQTLENGITLTFPGASTVATISGKVKINKVGNEDVTLRFDVEKFLSSH